MGSEHVSICMPVAAYEPRLLTQAVESVLDQTSPRWELLVLVERSSRSGVTEALAAYLDDPRLRVVENEGRQLAGAFNTGMSHARFAFAAILLGDDLWAPGAVQVLTQAIEERPEVDFFHSARMVVDEEGRPLSPVYPARMHVAPEDFLTSSPVKHLLCWRTELGLAIGGMDESLGSVGVDDYDFPWSMAEQGAVFMALPDCLYLYRDHRAGFRLTTHLPLDHHKREIARILAKHGAAPEAIERKLAAAESSYLRQCLYRSRLDRWLKTRRGFDPRSGWREAYRS